MAVRKSIFMWLVLVIAALCVGIGQATAQENPYQSRRQQAREYLGQAIQERMSVDPLFKRSVDSIVDSQNAQNARGEALFEQNLIDLEDAQCLDGKCSDATQSDQ